MPLPPKPYFFLPEVAERWGTTVVDLATFAHEGLIEICAMTINLRVDSGWFEDDDDGRYRMPAGDALLNGPQALIASDIGPILQNRIGTITRFKARYPHWYLELPDAREPIRITLQQLLVMREERDRFETEYGLAVEERPSPRHPTDFGHNADYTDITLLGQRFVLGSIQARIIGALYEASRAGQPWVPQSELLDLSGSKSTRLVDVFKAKANWRALIAFDGKGRCRLNLPDRAPSKTRQRAFRRAIGSRR